MLGSRRRRLAHKGETAKVLGGGVLRSDAYFPRTVGGLASWYDMKDSSARIADTGIRLLADKSGNSADNCLCLNGAASNNASVPDSAALSITSDLSIRADVAAVDWTPGTGVALVSKWGGAGSRSFYFKIHDTNVIGLETSEDGTNMAKAFYSTAAPSVSDYGRLHVRVDLDVNNGSGQAVATFYTSSDGSTWTQLGTTVSHTSTITLFDSTSPVRIGSRDGTNDNFSGRVYRAQILNGIGGTSVLDADFRRVSKLAASFTEFSASAATVTINTSGDFGARIAGERDYVQMTGSKQATVSSGLLLFDGTDDHMKTPGFSIANGFTRYLVVNQKTWSSGDYICDGASANTAALIQTTGTPQLNISAGSSVAGNTGLAVDALGIVVMVFNGASSALRVGKATATTGNAGSGNPNGLTLGSSATPGNYGNCAVGEELVYSAVHDANTQSRVISFLARKWGIAA